MSILSLGHITINGHGPFKGSLDITQPVEYVRSDRATKPDLTWTFTDPAGHFHAFDKDGTLPTLDGRSIPQPCDGSCGGICGGEGYTITVYTCRACAHPSQLVEPRWVPDYEARTTGTPLLGLKDWSVKAEAFGHPEDLHRAFYSGDLVSVQVDQGHTVYFGFGRVVATETHHSGEMLSLEIVGDGALGEHKRDRASTAPAASG